MANELRRVLKQGFGVAAIAVSPPTETESEPDGEAVTEPTD
jgi:hypothetical protein